jgi:hypothetical protein
LPLGSSLQTDTLLVKRRRAAYSGTRRWPQRMPNRPTGAAAAREVPLRRQGQNLVERRRSPDVVAQRERWTKLATPTIAELDSRSSSPRPAPKRTAHATLAVVAQIVARLPRRTDQILDLCAAYTGHRRRLATPLEGLPRPLMTEVHSIRQIRTFEPWMRYSGGRGCRNGP